MAWKRIGPSFKEVRQGFKDISHPTLARCCEVCDYKWFARPAARPFNRPGPLLHTAGRNIAFAEQQRRWEALAFCQRCGSNKVKTVKGRALKKFKPTAAENSSA